VRCFGEERAETKTPTQPICANPRDPERPAPTPATRFTWQEGSLMASFFKKTMLYLGLGPDEEYEVYDDEPEPIDRRESVTPVTRASGRPAVSPLHEPSGSVRPIRAQAAGSHVPSSDPVEPRPVARSTSSVVRPLPRVTNGKPHTVAPSSFNDAQQVADHYKSNQPVIVNLEAADRDLRRRLIDFCSGLCYGLGGQMERVADNVYLLTPSNVELSAEDRRRLERGE
jgi:cell division inhibitor SepF